MSVFDKISQVRVSFFTSTLALSDPLDVARKRQVLGLFYVPYCIMR